MTQEKPLVVLIGPGDCASREELLHLTKMMLAGQIDLVVIGKGPFETIRKDIWKKNDVPFIEDLLREGFDHLSYIDIDSPTASGKILVLQTLNPRLVHITTPNNTHIPLIYQWSSALVKRRGIVTVQKPLTSDLNEALAIQQAFSMKITSSNVFGFDHYASKVYPCFVNGMAQTLRSLVGNIKTIQMRFLEQYCVTLHRAYTLQGGMTEDWGAHVFALLGIFADWSTTPSFETLDTVEFSRVHRGRYPGAPIEGDTYFWAQGKVMDIPFDVMAGKGIGDASEKWARIIGDQGTLLINFDTNQFMIEDNPAFQPQSTNKAHTETFLKAILLEGKRPEEAPGVHSIKSAAKIVVLIHGLQKAAPKLFAYIPGAYVKGVGNTLGMMEYAERNYSVPLVEIPIYKEGFIKN